MTSRLPLWAVAIAILFGGAWAGWLGAGHLAGRSSVLDRAEAVLADLRLLVAGPRPSPRSVAIVAIDDDTVAEAGGYPIPRARLAALVRAIAASGARALAVDLLLVDKGDVAADQELADAFRALPTVIAAAGSFDERAGGKGTLVPNISRQLLPLATFRETTAYGFVNVAIDAGGTPRHIPLLYQTSDGPMPSIVLNAIGLFNGSAPALVTDGVRIAGAIRRLDLGFHLPLRILGPQGTVETVSAQTVLRGDAADSLKGRLVFLGSTATAVGDRFSTPFDRVLPGVEVLATGAANLIDGTGLVRDPEIRRIDVAATLALALLGVFVFWLLPFALATAAFAGALGAWLAAIAVLFGHNNWLCAALPIAATLPPVAGMALARQIFDRRQARREGAAHEALARFQAPALARRIASDPTFLREPIACDAAILFVDLSGFTGLSEQLGPAASQKFLKGFHTLIVDAVEKHEGHVMTFMGDGAMVVFGIPDTGPDDAEHALDAAFALVTATMSWIRASDLQEQIQSVRIGCHFGSVIVSRLGHEDHQQITATGDCVNVASRLMEAAKAEHAWIAASSDLMAAVGAHHADRPAPEDVKEIAIRGRGKRISVAFWRGQTIGAGDAAAVATRAVN